MRFGTMIGFILHLVRARPMQNKADHRAKAELILSCCENPRDWPCQPLHLH